MPENNVVLSVKGIGLSFGGIKALMDVDLEIRKGEIFALIGPNGAGKTSLFNCINGFYRPQEGSIYFEGREITRLPSYERSGRMNDPGGQVEVRHRTLG